MCLYAVAILALACCRFPARFERVPPLPARWLGWLGSRLPADDSPLTTPQTLPAVPAWLPPSPPLPPHTPRVGGFKVCAPLAFARGALLNRLTYAVGLLVLDCSNSVPYWEMC